MLRVIQLFILSIVIFLSVACFGGVTNWSPLEVKDGYTIIEIEVKNKIVKAKLDNTLSHSFINSNFLIENNLSLPSGKKSLLMTSIGLEKSSPIKKQKIKINGNELILKNVFPISMSEDFDMILGKPFFGKFIIQLDYPNKKYRLMNHADLDLKNHANLDLEQMIIGWEKSLVFYGEINENIDAKLLFDLGNNKAILLEREFAEKYDLIKKYKSSEYQHSGNISSKIIVTVSDIPSSVITSLNNDNDANKNIINYDLLTLALFKLGPFLLEDVEAYVAEEEYSVSVLSASDWRGAIGYDILKHFIVTLDVKNAKAHLAPP